MESNTGLYGTMSIEKLQRVIWRLQEIKPKYRKDGVTRTIFMSEIRKAIMYEIGTDERTIRLTLNKLKELKWIKRYTRHGYELHAE